MMRTAAALMAFILFAQASPGGPVARIADLHARLVAEAGIVGSSLVLVKAGAIAGRSMVGFQDLDTRRPVDADTIFHWASITKMFTGVAIMQLRDRGRLSLDDPVVRFVPELRQVHNPFGDIEQVRVRHLMSHSAGFRASTWPWGGSEPWHPFEPTRWEQLVAMLPYTDLRFAPGSQYAYSNPAVVFLGRIIEVLSGDEYETYITKNILMPLGMTRTFFDRAPYHLVRHRSHSYQRSEQGLVAQRFDFDTGITAANGGLNAPLDDMARWLAFLLGGGAPGAGREADDPVLKASSLAEMFTPQIRARDGEGGSGQDVQAGLSCFIERHHGVELVGHSGDQNGFISHLYLHRPSRSGYVVSFNTNTVSARPGAATTRGADEALRDAVVREVLEPAGAAAVRAGATPRSRPRDGRGGARR
jgi:CubicO group peptidase (beta-lactamase class C family)